MSETKGKAPTAQKVDELIAEFAAAQAKVQAAAVAKKLLDETAEALKARLVAMVQEFGAPHAEKSKRLAGNHNTATITTGTQTSIDAAAVEKLKRYLDMSSIEGLTERFLTERVTYQLVAAPSEVLKTIEAPTNVRTRLKALIGLCFQTTTKSPSLKVSVVELQKAA